MEEFILIRPTSEYAGQIVEYRQEFLDAGDSMDGTGPLRRIENPEEYIKVSKENINPAKPGKRYYSTSTLNTYSPVHSLS